MMPDIRANPLLQKAYQLRPRRLTGQQCNDIYVKWILDIHIGGA